MKYLLTLALIVLFASMASMSFAADWIGVQYNTPITVTGPANTWKVPTATNWAVQRYVDVATDHWAWAMIEECSVAATASSSFIVQGVSTTVYLPDAQVNRASMAVFIARAAGLDFSTDPSSDPFLDVPVGFWADNEIQACVDAGVVQGYPDGLYRPLLSVTRDQMAVYIQRAAIGSTSAYTGAFVDIQNAWDPGWWAKDDIQACVDANIVAGYPDGLYRPGWVVNRDQMATFVWRAFVRGVDGDVVLGGPAATDTAGLDPGASDNDVALFLPDDALFTTTSGANEITLANNAVVYIVLDAVQLGDGTIDFDVSGSSGSVGSASTAAISAPADTVTKVNSLGSPAAPYLAASYRIPDLSGSPDTYTVTVTLPGGAVLTIGTFVVS